MKKLILILIMAGISYSSFAATPQENEIAYQKLMVEFKETKLMNVPEFKKLACDGQMESQLILAKYLERLAYGKFESLFWLIENAERGNEEAQFLLSAYYKKNLKFQANIEEGYRWFKIYSRGEAATKAKLTPQIPHPFFEEEKNWQNYTLSLSVPRKKQIENQALNWNPIKEQKVENCLNKLNKFLDIKMSAEPLGSIPFSSEENMKLIKDQDDNLKKVLANLETKTDIKSIYEVSNIYYSLYIQNKLTIERKNKLIINLNELVNKNYPDGLRLLAQINQDGKLVPKNVLQALIIYKKLKGINYEYAENNYNALINPVNLETLSIEDKIKLFNYLETSPEKSDKYLLIKVLPLNNIENAIKLKKIYEKLSADGDREASFKLAEFYSQETNALKDMKKSQDLYNLLLVSATDQEKLRIAAIYEINFRNNAFIIYKELALKGNNAAKLKEADFYIDQNYKETFNPEKSLKIWEELANQGSFFLQQKLASVYMGRSYNIPSLINYKRAFYWNKKLANESYLYKYHEFLVILYIEGKGTSKNNIEAYKWLYIMETKFNDGSKNALKLKLEKEMSKKDIEKAKILADNWIRPTK